MEPSFRLSTFQTTIRVASSIDAKVPLKRRCRAKSKGFGIGNMGVYFDAILMLF